MTIDDFSRPQEYISPLDKHLGSIIRQWAEEDVMPYRRQFDEDWKDHKIIEPAYKKLMVDLGLQMCFFPEEVGGWGLGHSNSTATISYRMFEEIGRADTAMAVAFGVTFWPLTTIVVEPHVNMRLCKEFASMFNTDKPCFSALAMTEPQGGSDIENIDLLKGRTIQTTAILDGDEWVINGHKLWPSNTGGVADLLAVVCTTKSGSDDPNDFALIFVPSTTKGATQGGPYEKAGMAADKNSDVWFEDVRVPSWYRAAGPGDDAICFEEVISWGQMGSSAFLTGAMMNLYEILYKFCSEKTYNKKPLKENDAIAALLGRIAGDLDICRVIGYQAARMVDRPDIYGGRGSRQVISKIRNFKEFIADRAVENFGKAMDILGFYGADRDWDIEKHWRDIKIIQLWMGGKQLCQMEAARYFFDCKTL